MNYQYNTLGNKTKTTYPDGSVVDYNYDNANRLASIINGSGRTYSFQYDSLGRRTKLTMPNGAYATYTYNTIGILTNLTYKTSSGSIIDSFTYTHDKVGNRLTKTETNVKYNYSYDAIYRLMQSLPTKLTGKDKEQDNKSEYFSYDAVGNRLRGPDTKDFYSYNQINQLTEDRKHSYQYDKNGNLIKKTETDDDGKTETTTYSYDYENRLIKVVKQEEDETKTVTFKYDPFGRRIEKKVEEIEDGKTETKTYSYVYDNEDIILEYLTKAEDGKTKTETTRYVHGPGIDEQLAIERKDEVYYYHADGLGSITALTDKKQKVVESYTYSSFGEVKRKGDKVKNTFTFTGREWDEETGLYYYRARYYDAKVGRFTTHDPSLYLRGNSGIPYLLPTLLTTPQELNHYIYSQDNPQTLSDPYGLSVMLCTRQAFSADWGKENPFYIVPHCYIVAGSNIFSWNIQAGGGIHGYEKPGNNVCSAVKCCGDEAAFENCVITEATAEQGREGNLWIPALHDCCTWAHKIVGKCRQKYCK